MPLRFSATRKRNVACERQKPYMSMEASPDAADHR